MQEHRLHRNLPLRCHLRYPFFPRSIVSAVPATLKQRPLFHIPAIYRLNRSYSLVQAIYSTAPDLLHHSLCFYFAFAPLPLKQPRLDLFLVPLVVQQQQPIQYLSSCCLADSISQSLLRLVKAMLQLQIIPPICLRYSLVHLPVQFPQRDDILIVLLGIVETIVGFGEPFLTSEHDGLAVNMVAFAYVVE